METRCVRGGGGRQRRGTGTECAATVFALPGVQMPRVYGHDDMARAVAECRWMAVGWGGNRAGRSAGSRLLKVPHQRGDARLGHQGSDTTTARLGPRRIGTRSWSLSSRGTIGRRSSEQFVTMTVGCNAVVAVWVGGKQCSRHFRCVHSRQIRSTDWCRGGRGSTCGGTACRTICDRASRRPSRHKDVCAAGRQRQY